jgi:peroxiredoxin
MPAPIIIADIDSFMIRAKTNKEIYKYSLNYLLDFLLSYQKAGLNLVFQHLAYTYALTDSVDWLDEKAKAMIKKTADEWTSASVGNQAPELNMATINGDSIDLYSLNTHFTLLLFWKTGCGHCLNTVKALKVFYDQTDSLDISIFAVFTKTDKADWQAFLDEEGIQNLWYNVWDEKETTNYHSKYYVISTPLLYVLDQNKIIVSIWNGDEEIKKLIDNLQSQRSKLQKIK